MNQAVPWNIKGVGFDAREIACMAAKRAGLSVGEWLDSVITERARSLGVAVADFSQDDRLDALVARLAGIADEAGVRRATGKRGESATLRTLSEKHDSEFRNDIVEPSLRVANGPAFSFDSNSSRVKTPRAAPGAKRNLDMTDWEKDALLDQALSLAEDHSRESRDATPSEAQRRKVAALSREVGRLSETEHHPIAAFEDRLAGWQRRMSRSDMRGPSRAPLSEAVGSVADRLELLEKRILQRDAAQAHPPVVSALARLEDRFDALAKRNGESAREAVRVEATFRDLDARLVDIAQKLDRREGSAPIRTHAEIERIDAKLASVLNRFDQTGSGAQGSAPSAGERSLRQDAVAEIARRQADLDGGFRNRTALLNESSYQSIGQAQRESRPDPATPVQDDGHAAFASLQGAFSALAGRLEARLENAIRDEVKKPDTKDDDLAFLKSGIAGLEQRLDALHQHSAARNDVDVPDTVKLLRDELAALSDGFATLVSEQSAATLGQAVQVINERMDLSRLEGVSEAVLAPVAKLNADLIEIIRETDPRAAIADLDRQVAEIRAKVESIHDRNVHPEAVNAMREETREVHALVKSAAGQLAASGRIDQEFAKLGARIDRLADTSPRAAIRDLEAATNDIRAMLVRMSPTGIIQELSHKIDRIADRLGDAEDRMALPAALFDDLTRRIDEAHASLSERIGAKVPVDLRPIEAMIGGLSGKVEGLQQNAADVHALGGLVRGLAAQIEDAQLPHSESKALDALENQVGRLAERLDHSDASLTALGSLERLIGELFHQVEDTKAATIEAAQTAARTAAQDALRISSVQNGESGASSLVAEQVSQELSALRQSQNASEKRVHATLLALNETLERMVDRLVRDNQAGAGHATPAQGAGDLRPTADADRRVAERRTAAPDLQASKAVPVRAALNLDEPLLDTEAKRLPVAAALPVSTPVAKASAPVATKAAAPAVEINRSIPGEPMPDVSPLIAAARRAAQAAQASAQATGRDKAVKVGAGTASGTASRNMLSVLRGKRRALLFGLAGVVLLLGALQIAKLTSGNRVDAAATATAPVGTEAAADATTPKSSASVSGDDAAKPAGAASVAASAPAAVAVAPSPPVAATDAATVKTDPTLAGLPLGLRDLASSGDAAAQYEVGVRLAEGRGVTRDLKAAASWFGQAAKQGLAPAQYRLGSVYEKGIGITADPAQATAWYEKAAEQGNARAMHNLAVMAAEGSGGKPDYAKAAIWFGKAANLGVRDSQFNLAILDARGLGVTQDMTQAYVWFAVAAAQGDADAAHKRDDVAAKLDPKALASAKQAAESFKPATPDRAANEVTAPPGGWDAVAAKSAPVSAAKDGAKAKIAM